MQWVPCATYKAAICRAYIHAPCRAELQRRGLDVDSLLTWPINNPVVQADMQRLVRTHWVELQPFDRRNVPRGQLLTVQTATAQRDNITLTAAGQSVCVMAR
jgi:hypothetical protein